MLITKKFENFFGKFEKITDINKFNGLFYK
jgi:hypothetical protein